MPRCDPLHRWFGALPQAEPPAIPPAPSEPTALSRSFEAAICSLTLAYQPIVRSGDGALFGYEALMRPSEPSLSNPGLMLDAAERLGRVAELGRTVRARAPSPLDQAPADALLFVNLHPQELLDPQLYCADTPLAHVAGRIVLEVTERAALHELDGLRDRVLELRSLGFRIAVDDLGSGYSGLSSLADLAPEFVKLDLSLTRDVDQDPLRRRIVRSMASLCREVGAQVVAEGIERAGERDAVAELGCDFIQGYFVARPGALGAYRREHPAVSRACSADG